MSNSFQVQFPSDLDYIPPLRHFVSEIAKSGGYDGKFCFRTEIIVDELCTNAILHGSSRENSFVEMSLDLDDEKMNLSIRDKGGNRNDIDSLKRAVYNSKPEPDNTRGRGMDIVQMLANELTIDLDENGNTQVHVVKNREAEEPKRSN